MHGRTNIKKNSYSVVSFISTRGLLECGLYKNNSTLTVIQRGNSYLLISSFNIFWTEKPALYWIEGWMWIMNSEGYGNGIVEVLVSERYHLSATKNNNLIEDNLTITQKC
jgi:hypothetical protein